VQYRLFGQILVKLGFSGQSFEKSSDSIFMKIRPVGAELFRADSQPDGRTDTTKLIVAFRNFANAPNQVGVKV
jgi:hypothetical protein